MLFSFITSSIRSLKMWGNGYGNYGAMQNELASDMWIQQNVPGGLNGKSDRMIFMNKA